MASAKPHARALFDGSAAAIGVRRALSPGEAASSAARVIACRSAWTSDFGGEQFALGRAFYTHLETGAAATYFAHAAQSDAAVERALPGMQASTRALLEELIGGLVRPRPGFAGPGVHVFPAGDKVAREGGVVHFDLEGLTDHHLATDARAVTLVVMLQPPETGGGLRLWDALHDGTPDTELDTEGIASTTARSHAGDALLIDSRRLHQIQPFGGLRDRISITVHAVEVDRGRCWEAWF
ncbi:MAG: hypothetical protein U0414_31490 [Polyangiaceae bacterium]